MQDTTPQGSVSLPAPDGKLGAMHLGAAKWINENWMGTGGVLLWASLSLFHSQTSHTLLFLFFSHLLLPQALNSSSPDYFVWTTRTGGKWGEMARLYLNGDSQSASCIIMRSDISVHTKLFLSRCTFVHPSEAEYPSSQPDDTFPTHLFFYPASTPEDLHNPLFSSPSRLSTLEYPVFHLAAR